ncbi:GNAT family N-acetyltransferase [Phytohabitans sp. LJ34]|uniref:GNAT family N-acetyltransferase n=1 Tax=Phytohabitans sp. LJ34 TaxID=3452217 RepID=UPI003F8C1EF6
MTVALPRPAPASEWPAPDLPSQTPAWLRCVCAVGGYRDASRLYEVGDGRRLVLPLVWRRGRGASLPLGWGPGGIVADGGVRPGDVRLVGADLAGLRALGVHIRPDPAYAAVWEAAMPAGVRRERRMSQALPLDGGFDRVWRTRFHSDARNRARRAERHGVTVERDDTGRLLPVFHALYAESVDRWARHEGVPPALARWRAARREPPRKLRAVMADRAIACRLYGAFLDGRPVAVIVVLFGTGTAVYWRGAMADRLAGPCYANYLLQRTAIEDAVEAGCAVYQMGDSAPDSPLALFKSRFGAVAQHYATYDIETVPVSAVAGRAQAAARRVLRARADRS